MEEGEFADGQGCHSQHLQSVRASESGGRVSARYILTCWFDRRPEPAVWLLLRRSIMNGASWKAEARLIRVNLSSSLLGSPICLATGPPLYDGALRSSLSCSRPDSVF